MTEPAESSAASDPQRAREDAPPVDERVIPTEVDHAEGESPGELAAADGQPEALREIAHAFRMNAEALQTLKQMQLDLTRTLERGDRSELVLQSTRALNDTFRNLSTVQRELLSRIDSSRGGRGPLIPLMILGLLVVVVGGVYLILDAVEKSSDRKPQVDPGVIAQRVQDSWKDGRREGSLQAEREIQRLQDLLDESKDRTNSLEQNLQAKLEALSELDRGRRAAELERDQFAGQVRKAQNEVLAKQALEDEVASLRQQIEAANRAALDMQVDLDRQKRVAAHLRDRMADYGMDLPEDDPPYRGPPPASPRAADSPAPETPAPEAPAPAAPAPEAASPPPSGLPRNLLDGGRDTPSVGDPTVAPPRAPAAPRPAPEPAAETPASPWSPATPAATPAAAPSPARRSGLPPPTMRPRSVLDRSPTEIRRVRTVLNQLLDASPGPNGESWRVTRIDGIAQDRLGGVIVLHYDASGRLLDAVEARDLRITVDSDERAVAFDFLQGVHVRRNSRTPLPAAGKRLVVAKGDASGMWAASGLTMIRKR
jgi:hypothetical protein